MALSHSREMWNYCRCSHKFFKLKKTVCTVTSFLMKVECTVGQFSTCLKRNSFSNQPNHSFRQKNNLSTSSVLLKNAVAKEVVTSAMEDIDFEKLKEQVQKERKLIQNNVHMKQKLDEAVSKKCDEILASLGPEDMKKLKVIQLEHSFLFSKGHSIIDAKDMLSQNWLEALKLPSLAQRLKYYIFLNKRKFRKESEKMKRTAKEEQVQERERREHYEHGRLFFRIYESTMKRWLNYRLAASMQFGIPLVIDMDYTSYMRPQEMRNTAAQLRNVYCINRTDEELPFHLHFTSCQQDNSIYRLFQVMLDEDQGFLATVSEKSYLDLFDKKNLVYLSPNGRHVMQEFDPNAVYIIGAFNDKATMQPISYARAKEQQIRCERLPIDTYMKWQSGSKSLTLDQMIKIMLSVKNKKPWQEALQAVPKRKTQTNEDSDEEVE